MSVGVNGTGPREGSFNQRGSRLGSGAEIPVKDVLTRGDYTWGIGPREQSFNQRGLDGCRGQRFQ